MLLLLATVFAGLYLALLYVGAFRADEMIFLPHPSSYKDTPEILKISTQTGKKISAVYLPNADARFTLLVSHGNAEDIGDARYWLEDVRRAGFSGFAYDYEGYGTSEGKPSEQAVYDDEDAAYDYLTLTLKIPPQDIIIYGRSVGSGPAVHIAARKPAAGLILQSPFVSAFRVLTHIPLLPFDKFPNDKDIRRVRCPLLIIHGDADTVIAPWHGKKLFDLANEPKKFLSIPRANHNDLEMAAGKSYYNTLRDFAASLRQISFAIPPIPVKSKAHCDFQNSHPSAKKEKTSFFFVDTASSLPAAKSPQREAYSRFPPRLHP